MRSRANTLISWGTNPVYDEYGDPVTEFIYSFTDVAASLIERRQVVANSENNNEPNVIRWAVLRVNRARYNKFFVGTIVLDQKTGVQWEVDEITKIENPFLAMDARMQLKRVSNK